MGKISLGDNIIYDDTGGGETVVFNQIPYTFASTIFNSSYDTSNAFDESMANAWSANGNVGQYIGICFKMPVKVYKLFLLDTNNRLKDFVFEGSDNGISYTPILSTTRPQIITESEFNIDVETNFKYYRIRCSGALYTGSNMMMTNIKMEYQYLT